MPPGLQVKTVGRKQRFQDRLSRCCILLLARQAVAACNAVVHDSGEFTRAARFQGHALASCVENGAAAKVVESAGVH